MSSEIFGTPIGYRKLKQLRSSTPAQRSREAAEFAGHLADFLPQAVSVTFMPSSTRKSIESDRASIPYLVRSHLQRLRPDIIGVEPLMRTSPVSSVHEDRSRDIALLKSTLEPAPMNLASDTLHVIDDMIATGATYAAFRSVFREHWPDVRTVLMAFVYSPKRSNPLPDTQPQIAEQ
jgi:hypothetical protein